jgi:DivIVA domain-containing protein
MMTTTLPNHHHTLQDGVEMPLTPDEISRKSFPSVLRGYAKWEVDEFLKDVALDYQRALGLAEWAMQRASAPATATTGYSVASSVGPISATVSDEFTTMAAPADHNIATPSGISVSATNTAVPASETQVSEISEHIRYLAVLVNSMTQRLDTFESRLIALTQLPASTPPPGVATPAPATATAPLAPPVAAPAQPTLASAISTSDWWPAESPLWVVTRDDRAKVGNSYGPRV